MKIFLTSLLAVFLLNNPAIHPLSAQELHFRSPPQSTHFTHSPLPWADSYEQAIEQAKRTHQTVVLLFTGSDWCHWCKILEKEFLSNSSFAQTLHGEFLFVCVDFPRSRSLAPHVTEQNRHLRERFNVSGLPTLLILDSHENVLGRSGYLKMSPTQFAAHLQAMRHTRSS